ncbi:MAG: NAD-dependent deacylase [Chloroflexi bacterium]|nr:NAD-dependent deacylase [Chloroflexota bacterium]
MTNEQITEGVDPSSNFQLSTPDLQRLISSKRVVALTGAGVSAESGIPTFRDAQTGLWSKYDPMQLATPEAFARNPKLVWDWYQWRRDLFRDKKPNAGHYALAEMEKIFPHFVVVTQNIDGLHRMAGSTAIVELHGNISRDKCSRENVVIERAQAKASADGLFKCPRCGAYLRPDVVWFGETLPRDALDRAFQEAMQCDVLLSIGTSALVEPAASLPRIAQEAGAFIIEINPDETPLSQSADAVLRGKSGGVLPQLAALLKRKM